MSFDFIRFLLNHNEYEAVALGYILVAVISAMVAMIFVMVLLVVLNCINFFTVDFNRAKLKRFWKKNKKTFLLGFIWFVGIPLFLCVILLLQSYGQEYYILLKR